jgi:hypothetical protein
MLLKPPTKLTSDDSFSEVVFMVCSGRGFKVLGLENISDQ